MFCKKCGKSFEPILSNYCPYCGIDDALINEESNFFFELDSRYY